jgi:hypothetical protein
MEDTINRTKEALDNIPDLKNIVASGFINFLFGAGVNGTSFSNFQTGFEKTKEALRNHGKEGISIENELSELDDAPYDEVIKVLVDEYNDYSATIEYKSKSITNLKRLLNSVYNLVEKAENRQPYMKKINVFTLNYDRIVENVLDESGYLFHSITADKLQHTSPYDTIGYDTSAKKFIPAFAISKLHGSVDINNKLNKSSIILPSRNKLRHALSNDFFSTLFKMKSELEKRNAILFIIGYSGADDDVNNVLRDSIHKGLTVYWLRYNNSDNGVKKLNLSIRTIEPVDESESFQDTTKTLSDIFNRLSEL